MVKTLYEINSHHFELNVGLSDVTGNYFHVIYKIDENKGKTKLIIINDTFDGNEDRTKHVMQGWELVTEQMKKVVTNF